MIDFDDSFVCYMISDLGTAITHLFFHVSIAIFNEEYLRK